MASYRPEELFDDGGRVIDGSRRWPRAGDRRMSANPHANGGLLRNPLVLRDFRERGVEVDRARRIGPRADQGDWASTCWT